MRNGDNKIRVAGVAPGPVPDAAQHALSGELPHKTLAKNQGALSLSFCEYCGCRIAKLRYSIREGTTRVDCTAVFSQDTCGECGCHWPADCLGADSELVISPDIEAVLLPFVNPRVAGQRSG